MSARLPFLHELSHECRAGGLPRALAAGLIIALAALISAIGVAALVFTGPLAPFMPGGLGVVLIAAVVLLVTAGLGSSIAGTIALPQEVPAVVLGLLATGVFTALAPTAGEPVALAAVATVTGLATMLTGAAFLALGHFRLGLLVRFLPYPVLGGVMASMGWLLPLGATAVITGEALAEVSLTTLANREQHPRLLAAAIIGVVLFAAGRANGHYLLLPTLLAGAVAAFYAVWGLVVGSPAEAMATGWLAGPFPAEPEWRTPSGSGAAALDAALILAQLPTLATLVFTAVICLLLYATAVELGTRQDMDLDRDLRAAGWGNLIAGLAGGPPGFHSISDSTLVHRLDAGLRLTPLIAAGALLLVLLLAFPLLAWFPRPVLAGLLLFLGLNVLWTWLIQGWHSLPRGDYIVVVGLLVVTATVGLIEAIGVGLLAGLALFVMRYSRIDAAQYMADGRALSSHVDRPASQREVLRARGERILVIALRGFLFFGSAHRILDRLRRHLASAEGRHTEFIVLDFRRVAGLDTSAALTFGKIRQLAARHGIRLVFCDLPPEARRILPVGGLDPATDPELHVTPDLDHALEWCEEILLQSEATESGSAESADARVLQESLSEMGLDPYLEAVEMSAGDVIAHEGDASDDVYFVIAGRITIRLRRGDRDHRLRTFRAGTAVGEIALYRGGRRSADIVADGPVRLLRLSRAQLDRFSQDHPHGAARFHAMMATLLCERLERTNALVRSLQ